MFKFLILSLASSVSVVSLSVVHERRGDTGRQAWETSKLDRNAIVPMRIGLAQRNLEKGYDYILNVSDPDSTVGCLLHISTFRESLTKAKNYGKHWTAVAVETEFAPSDESVRLVKKWLKEQGIEKSRQTSNKGWISFDAPVHRIERLFQAEFQQYSTKDGVVRIGCDEYSLPRSLIPHVDYITPGVKLSPPLRMTYRKRGLGDSHLKGGSPPMRNPPNNHRVLPPGALNLPPDLRNCGFNITPPCYRALYNIPAPGEIDIPDCQIGIFEGYYDAYAQEDLNDFFTTYAPYVPNGTHPNLFSINGAQAPVPQGQAGGESDVDFSIAYSLLGAADISLYETQTPQSYNGSFANIVDPFLDAIDGSYCDDEEKAAGFQCGAYPLSTVLSTSYSTPELFYQSKASQVRTCNEFMKLSLQGHTFVFSSGDYGVASNPGYGDALCIANGCIPQNLNNTGEGAYTGSIFLPGFPNNCPYVLAVGGTQLSANQTVNDPESVMHVPHIGFAGCPPSVSFSSGGGFANYFSRPSYQDDAVGEYFQNYVPSYPYYESNFVDVTNSNTTIGSNNGIYNRNGRAIPDVSANGAYLLFYDAGEVQQVFGTSLSTPIWASIITLLNAERAALGKSPVGFINPTLYKNPQVFNDITVGGNPGCYTDGFPAVKGWDPSSGLGTPDYAKLSVLFKTLP